MATTTTRSRRSEPDPPPRAGRRRRRRSWLWRYRRVFFLFAILAATAFAGLVFVLFQVPVPDAPSLQLLNQTTVVTDAGGAQLATFHGVENRTVVPLKDVPVVVRQAVVSAEDKSFYRHSGVDPVGLARATWQDIRHRNARQGGSTITQQYVKGTYVGRDRTLVRKLKEAVISVKLERKLSKDEILERYLNTIYFGRGAYGVQAAAQAYFGKDVKDLGVNEGAYLAAIIRNPTQAENDAAATRRRDGVLRTMADERYITAAQRRDAQAVPLFGEGGIIVPRQALAARSQVAGSGVGTQYYVEYVRRFLVQRYGEKAVYGGGLRVKTTLDMKAQTAAYHSVYDTLNRANDPAGALVALDQDGNVRAMVGGKDWEVSKVNLAVGTAGGGRGRQAGSTFKPFVLAETVKEGYTVESSLTGPAKIVLPKADQGHDWPVSNYEGASYGRINLIDATRNSVNTVYAQLVTLIGPDKVAEMANALGIQSKLSPVPSITLGTQNVSVLEMANAYLTLANRGVRIRQPLIVTEVRDASGKLIESFRPQRERVLSRDQADVVNFVLRQVVEEGSGTGAQFGRPLAGKTGTTQDFGDAWFIGYTPKLTAAVWMGYPEGQSRKMVNVHGKKVNGGSFPASIFKRFMTAATAGVDTGDFPVPKDLKGKVLSGDRIKFDLRDATESSTVTTRSGRSSSSTTRDSSATTAPAGSPGTTAPAPATTTSPTTRPSPPTTAASPPTTAAPAPRPTRPSPVPTTAVPTAGTAPP